MLCRSKTCSRQLALLVAVVFICLAAQAGNDSPAVISAVIDVRSEDLLNQPPTTNWISYNGDYSGRRYSGLSEINPGNLSGLRAQWVFHAGNTKRLEVTPVVINGIMLLTAANDAFAIDARTGRVVWHHALADLGRSDRRRVRPHQPGRRRLAQSCVHGNG